MSYNVGLELNLFQHCTQQVLTSANAMPMLARQPSAGPPKPVFWPANWDTLPFLQCIVAWPAGLHDGGASSSAVEQDGSSQHFGNGVSLGAATTSRASTQAGACISCCSTALISQVHAQSNVSLGAATTSRASTQAGECICLLLLLLCVAWKRMVSAETVWCGLKERTHLAWWIEVGDISREGIILLRSAPPTAATQGVAAQREI
eukprot:171808-Pelagomonas_calceolata.AAC.4